ncbi:MAG TPA: CHAD domain-containing protein, partial [Terriglobia bacterium]|nr:CHAD domain-containing protein [Terriglobia bacterium]
DWTVGDYRSAFEKVLLRQYEALISARHSWEESPDIKRFQLMRVELRNLRYTCETIADVLGMSRAHRIQSSLATLKSLQTTMGKIHDIHKLGKELVAWVSSRPFKTRALRMTVTTELENEIDCRMVEFKGHSLASGELLPRLQGQTTRRAVTANSSN